MPSRGVCKQILDHGQCKGDIEQTRKDVSLKEVRRTDFDVKSSHEIIFTTRNFFIWCAHKNHVLDRNKIAPLGQSEILVQVPLIVKSLESTSHYGIETTGTLEQTTDP